LASITLVFHGNLLALLGRKVTGSGEVHHILERRASVKDVVESFGVPHPEIKELQANGRQVGFDYIVADQDRIEVWPLSPPCDVFTPTVLRSEPLATISFVVDANVGKLAVLLRMAGFDTLYHPDFSDTALARTAAADQRILLTRDRNLLKRKNVVFGHLIREMEPWQQLLEVVCLYQLADKLQPFCRCLRCNTVLTPVAKEKIIHRLEPLTIKYYESFQHCTTCDRIYWPGSHRQSMQGQLTALAGECRVAADKVARGERFEIR
jgi:uncharacterized protein with PIN domain